MISKVQGSSSRQRNKLFKGSWSERKVKEVKHIDGQFRIKVEKREKSGGGVEIMVNESIINSTIDYGTSLVFCFVLVFF